MRDYSSNNINICRLNITFTIYTILLCYVLKNTIYKLYTYYHKFKKISKYVSESIL